MGRGRVRGVLDGEGGCQGDAAKAWQTRDVVPETSSQHKHGVTPQSQRQHDDTGVVKCRDMRMHKVRMQWVTELNTMGDRVEHNTTQSQQRQDNGDNSLGGQYRMMMIVECRDMKVGDWVQTCD